MILAKDGKALAFNGEILKCNAGFVKVDELPIENIKEGIIYKTNKPQNADIIWAEMYDNTLYTTSLKEGLISSGVTDPVFEVVDEQPSEPVASDLTTYMPVHIYIWGDVGYLYGDIGYGNMWIPCSTIINSLFELNLEDKGYTKGKTNIIEEGIYVTYLLYEIGVKEDKKVNLYVYDGDWIDYRSIFDKTIKTFNSRDLLTIESGAFYCCDKLKEVTLPNINYLGNRAFFGCESLETVDFKDNNSLTDILYETFAGCLNLKNVNLPNNLLNIGESAFNDCNIQNIIFPEDLKYIGNESFYSNGFVTITIPDSVSYIGNNAFGSCWDLKTIKLPKNISNINDRTFLYCSSLTEITIPENVRDIGTEAFYRCTSLTDVIFPNNLNRIKEEAFSYCESLKSISIPESVTYIGSGAFQECNNLESITVPFVGLSITSGADYFGAIFGANNVDNNNQYIPKSLKEVIITGGTYIGYKAFCGCDNIEKVTLPNGLTNIHHSVFKDCTSLKEIILNNSDNLTIEAYAFYNCSNLTDLYLGVNGIVTLYSTIAFEDAGTIQGYVNVHVKSENANDYENETNWSSLIESGKIKIIGDM